MWSQIKPQYWVGWYDRWHLLLPVAILCLGGWLASRPIFPVAEAPAATTPAPTAPLSSATQTGQPAPPAQPTRPVQPTMAPSVIDHPLTGNRFRNDVPLEMRGRAQPGSLVTLYYRAEGEPAEALAQARTDAEGRFRFQLQGFGAGRFQFQIQAQSSDGQKQVSLPVEYIFYRPS